MYIGHLTDRDTFRPKHKRCSYVTYFM